MASTKRPGALLLEVEKTGSSLSNLFAKLLNDLSSFNSC